MNLKICIFNIIYETIDLYNVKFLSERKKIIPIF